MKQYLHSFFEDFSYPEESRATLISAFDKICTDAIASESFFGIIKAYDITPEQNYGEINAQSDAIADMVGVHKYTVGLLTYICLSRRLGEYYRMRGIPMDIYRNSMLDLRYKLTECKLVKGVDGSFVYFWFGGFFNLTRFALGRLQFEIMPSKNEYTRDGRTLHVGDPVINVHIPRTGTPLLHSECLEAYAMAKEFFRDSFKNSPVAFRCSTWLFLPDIIAMLKDGSNIKSFASDFDIIESGYREAGEYKDIWRLYDMDYTGDLADLPEDTSFRRSYKKYLMSGGKEGHGLGLFFG